MSFDVTVIEPRLLPRQRIFVARYFEHNCDAQKAALEAGYRGKDAGTNLLARTDIKRAIESRVREQESNTGVSVKWVVAEIKDSYEAWKQDKDNYSLALRCLELLGK